MAKSGAKEKTSKFTMLNKIMPVAAAEMHYLLREGQHEDVIAHLCCTYNYSEEKAEKLVAAEMEYLGIDMKDDNEKTPKEHAYNLIVERTGPPHLVEEFRFLIPKDAPIYKDRGENAQIFCQVHYLQYPDNMVKVNAAILDTAWAESLSEDERFVIVKKIKMLLGIEIAILVLHWDNHERTYTTNM